MEESKHSGRSVRDWASLTTLVISSASSASGAPMLTSSTIAPPATCCSMSISTLDRSPLRNCCWKIFLPVGLMRSPMMQNGLSPPMATSLLAERSTVSISHLRSGSCQRATLLKQFLGPYDGGRGIGGVAVGTAHVGVLLGDRRTADHHDHLIADALLLEQVYVRLEHRHRRGQEGGEPDDVGLMLADRGYELLRCYLHAQVDHLEAGPFEHDVHQVLADVVHIALDRAHHDLADGLGASLGQQRPQDLQRGRHRLARDQHFWHEEIAAFEPGTDLFERGDQRLIEQGLRAEVHPEAFIGELEYLGPVTDQSGVIQLRQ